MRAWLRRKARDERGVGVATALVITLVVFALGMTWTTVGLHQVQTSSYDRMREQALNAAEAGVNLALSQLAGQYDWPGSASTMALGDDTGEYEVTVTPVDPLDPTDHDRYIVAKGYAPTKASPTRAIRQVEQQVRLDPTDGFSYALFAAPGGLTGQNNSTITGDVYSAASADLANSAKYFGDVTSLANVTSASNTTIGGSVWAGGMATLDNAATTVQGNVRAVGNVSMTGTVLGDVQSGGSISGGTVNGVRTLNVAPPSPPALQQPTFTWDPANYTPTPSNWASAALFNTFWDVTRSAFSGHHRVTGGSGVSNTVNLDESWTMTGDVTIVSDGPIVLSRDITNGTSGEVTLTLVSFTATDPGVLFTNNVTLPSSVHLLIFAPNASADFSQLKDFHGVVYAEAINLSNQFTLSYAPPNVPGFSWSLASVTHYDVDVLTFREVAPTP